MPTSRSRAAAGRPYVICHMVPSVDGRIVTAGWPAPGSLHSEYERTAARLEGGGKINGSFLAAGCIDELSLLVAPVADGSVGVPTLFDSPGGAPTRLRLLSAQRRRGGLLWLRYRVLRGRR